MAYGKIKADTFVYDNSGSDVEVALSTIPPGNSPTFTGNVTINAQGDIRLADSDSSNYVGFQAPATVASNVVWTLPSADGSSGQQLSTNGSGVLSWTAPTNTAAGDLTGNTIASNVVTSSLTSLGTLTGLTINGDVTFTGASSNGLWDKSANAFVANLTGDVTGDVTGNCSGSSGSCTGNAATATTSTNVTVADESSDTSCNVLFTTAATGDLAPKSGTNLTFNSSTGDLTATILTDGKGNVRSIPRNAQSSNYTLVASDAGKHIYTVNNPTITIPAGTFASGDAITIINASTSDMTISRATGVSLYMPDGSDANCTVGKYGMVTILHSISDVFWITGSPLSQ